MDLRFSLGGTPSDSGGAPPGLPLPISIAPASTSSVLELRVTRGAAESGTGELLVCEARSGDGVSYARIEREVAERSQLAAGVRSTLARVGPEMPEPLLGSVTGVVLSLGGSEAAVLAELGLAVDEGEDPPASVDEALQARTGVNAGTPIRFGA